ncbi:MAG: hypothetical protein U5K54_12690 [Cytophagales bacterium]|nr:hypothetical protein [Cytophagales bacterium]
MAKKGSIPPIIIVMIAVLGFIAMIIQGIITFVETNPILSVSIIVIIGGAIYYVTTTNKEKRELELQRNTEELEWYKAEFLRIGDDYEKSGVPTIESDIILKKTESLYAAFHNVTWNEYRRKTTSISYSGLSARVGIMKGLSYRTGSMQIDRNSIDTITPIDTGDLYFTNKGLFFRGRLGNKNLPYNKIYKPSTNTKGSYFRKRIRKEHLFTVFIAAQASCGYYHNLG